MSKYIIEIGDSPFMNPFTDHALYKATNFNTLVFDENGLSKLEKHEETEHSGKTYEDGLNDAWEAARRIILPGTEVKNCLSGKEIEKIFGMRFFETLLRYSAAEAVAKLKDYDEQKCDRAKQTVRELADEIGIHKLYALVKEMRGE